MFSNVVFFTCLEIGGGLLAQILVIEQRKLFKIDLGCFLMYLIFLKATNLRLALIDRFSENFRY